MLLEPSDEPRLQLLFVLKTKFAHPLLRARVSTPAYFRAFVATDSDMRGGEQLYDFIEHVLEELDRRVLDTEDVLADPPSRPHAALADTPDGQLRIGCDGGACMAWRFDLRNDGNVTLGCKCDD